MSVLASVYNPSIPATERESQEDRQFKASLTYIRLFQNNKKPNPTEHGSMVKILTVAHGSIIIWIIL